MSPDEREVYLHQRARRQEAIANLGQQALQSQNTDALMATAVKLVASVLGVKYCAIMELLPNRAAFVLRAGTGWQRDWIGRITVSAREQSQEGYTLSTSEPVVVKDLRLETRFGGTPFLHNQGIISGASVAIAGEEASFGVLSVHSVQHRLFDEDDLHF
ncbi:MAG: GAF domain-containing protein [Coleofasciculaceae cyanobacterium SM2_3_26]|nr:GAF domain-containing protein [Coleofasciculaceae cyanobacterium SM2_3_26]